MNLSIPTKGKGTVAIAVDDFHWNGVVLSRGLTNVFGGSMVGKEENCGFADRIISAKGMNLAKDIALYLARGLSNKGFSTNKKEILYYEIIEEKGKAINDQIEKLESETMNELKACSANMKILVLIYHWNYSHDCATGNPPRFYANITVKIFDKNNKLIGMSADNNVLEYRNVTSYEVGANRHLERVFNSKEIAKALLTLSK